MNGRHLKLSPGRRRWRISASARPGQSADAAAAHLRAASPDPCGMGPGPALGKPRSRASARACRQARTCTSQTHIPTQAQTHHSPTHTSTTKPLPAPPRLQSFFPTTAFGLSLEIYGLQLLRCPESYLAAVEAVAVEGSRHTRSGQTMPRSVHLAVCLGQSISLSPHSLTAEVCFVCLHPSLAPSLPRSLAPSLGVPCSLAPSLARSLLPPSPSLPLSTPVLLVRPEHISQASAARLPGRGRPRGAEPLPNQHTLIGSRRRRANSGAPARARLRADGAGQAGVAEARGRSRAFGVRAAPRPLPCSAAHPPHRNLRRESDGNSTNPLSSLEGVLGGAAVRVTVGLAHRGSYRLCTSLYASEAGRARAARLRPRSHQGQRPSRAGAACSCSTDGLCRGRAPRQGRRCARSHSELPAAALCCRWAPRPAAGPTRRPPSRRSPLAGTARDGSTRRPRSVRRDVAIKGRRPRRLGRRLERRPEGLRRPAAAAGHGAGSGDGATGPATSGCGAAAALLRWAGAQQPT